MTVSTEHSATDPVRVLPAKDLPEAARAWEEIELACFSDPWTPGMIGEALASPVCVTLFALWGGRAAGVVSAVCAADECDVTDVAVLPAYRRRGIASALIGALLARLSERGTRHVYLEVRESNAPAIALYRSFSFFPCGRRKRYYTAPEEDAVVMTLDLSPENETR
ncbi:MAG: ribosomal protein S18-alanine N-acetyltransferase [Clostridia bacterium]|nr:ribosomal protein S18-alanine N-acetyltransferase [Clostridia bacterium]